MLSSFKKLLLRKTDSEEMQALVKGLSQESLAEYVVEALEKMAGNKGSNPAHNEALTQFTEALEAQKAVSDTGEAEDVALIRDAMGHHASAYKKSLEQGKMKQAQEHAKHFVRYGDLCWKIHRKNKDLLNFDVVHLQPWQRTNPAFKDKPCNANVDPSGKTWDCTGWKSHAHGGAKGDFSYLRNQPHEAYHKEIFRTPYGVENGEDKYHDGPYPMEHTKINNKYITLHDDAEPGSSHPMDHHPIMEAYKAGKGANYIEDLDKFNNSSAYDALNSKIVRAIDPSLGGEVGEPVHKPVDKSGSLDFDQFMPQSEEKSESMDFDQFMPQEQKQPEPKQDVKDIEDKLASMSPEDIDAMLARIRGRK